MALTEGRHHADAGPRRIGETVGIQSCSLNYLASSPQRQIFLFLRGA